MSAETINEYNDEGSDALAKQAKAELLKMLLRTNADIARIVCDHPDKEPQPNNLYLLGEVFFSNQGAFFNEITNSIDDEIVVGICGNIIIQIRRKTLEKFPFGEVCSTETQYLEIEEAILSTALEHIDITFAEILLRRLLKVPTQRLKNALESAHRFDLLEKVDEAIERYIDAFTENRAASGA